MLLIMDAHQSSTQQVHVSESVQHYSQFVLLQFGKTLDNSFRVQRASEVRERPVGIVGSTEFVDVLSMFRGLVTLESLFPIPYPRLRFSGNGLDLDRVVVDILRELYIF